MKDQRQPMTSKESMEYNYNSSVIKQKCDEMLAGALEGTEGWEPGPIYRHRELTMEDVSYMHAEEVIRKASEIFLFDEKTASFVKLQHKLIKLTLLCDFLEAKYKGQSLIIEDGMEGNKSFVLIKMNERIYKFLGEIC